MIANAKPPIALLPLYLELYDQTLPDLLTRQLDFLNKVVSFLKDQGANVLTLPVSRTLTQTSAAIAGAERMGAAGIITLHLAYSPSLESASALIQGALPILMLDTTPSPRFGAGATVDDVLANHGIHGVQDLASVLRREGRWYDVAAGPIDSPQLAAKMNTWLRAAHARHALQHTRVAQVGEAFRGMGDFSVTAEFLRESAGPELVSIGIREIGALCTRVSETDIAAEREADEDAFDCSECSQECRGRSNRVGLALRRALDAAGARAFSMNFGAFDRALGTPAVPFLEASKAMARGLGYAGEGDVLTASLVAALNQCYAPTTFTEMFCPDWESGRVFMSHMGECNPALAKGRPKLVEKEYAFGPADNPAVLVFPLKAGPAALVNLAPRQDELALIAADVEIDEAGLEPGLPGVPHFWIVPPGRDLPRFLESYSQAGGTHHLALAPGLRTAELEALASMMGWWWYTISP